LYRFHVIINYDLTGGCLCKSEQKKKGKRKENMVVMDRQEKVSKGAFSFQVVVALSLSLSRQSPPLFTPLDHFQILTFSPPLHC
jgi:hypothetical protein